MRKVVVFGYFGFNNYGDELLLETLLGFLVKEKNQVYILYNLNKNNFVHRNDLCHKYKGISFVNRWNWIKIFFVILKSNTLVCSGGLFQDKTSNKSLLYYLWIINLAKMFKKKVLVLGTEMDVGERNKRKVMKVFEKIDFLGVRNYNEVKKIKSLSKKINVEFFPDIIFSKHKNFSKKNKDGVIGLFLKIPDRKVYKKELENVIKLCDKLKKNFGIVFVPMHIGTDFCSEDYKFVLDVMSNLRGVSCFVWDNTNSLFNIISQIHVAIVSRFHAMLGCIVCGTKFLCISNENKLKNFMYDFNNYNEYVVNMNDINLDLIRRFIHGVDIEYENVCKKYKTIIVNKILSFKQQGYI